MGTGSSERNSRPTFKRKDHTIKSTRIFSLGAEPELQILLKCLLVNFIGSLIIFSCVGQGPAGSIRVDLGSAIPYADTASDRAAGDCPRLSRAPRLEEADFDLHKIRNGSFQEIMGFP
jgi:hypothetical protein